MDDSAAIELGRGALWQCLAIGGPILAVIMGVGLFMSVVQTVTNVHDSTVANVPKLLIVAVLLMLGLPWIMNTLVVYSHDMFRRRLGQKRPTCQCRIPASALSNLRIGVVCHWLRQYGSAIHDAHVHWHSQWHPKIKT